MVDAQFDVLEMNDKLLVVNVDHCGGTAETTKRVLELLSRTSAVPRRKLI